MGLEAFLARQGHGGGADLRQPVRAASHQRGPLEEVAHPEARGEPRAPRRRQHVARPGDVIADGFRHVAAEEDGARVPDPPGEGLRVVDGELQMLGRQPVDQRRRLVERADHDHRAVGPPAVARDGGARHRPKTVLDRRGDRIGEAFVVGDQHRLGAWIVLGLGQQVGGDPRRVVCRVRHHQDLGRARDQVDADGAEHAALGGGDISVAGTDDLVDRGDGGGPVGQRGDRLRPADAPDLVDARDLRRRQHQRVERAVGRRHRHDEAFDAGDPCRHGVHQDGTRIGGGAARNVQPHRGDRRPPHPQTDPVGVGIPDVLGHLTAVVIVDARRGELERRHRLVAAGGPRRLDLARIHAQFRHAVDRQPVELRGVFQQRRVAALAYLGDDLRHRVIDVGIDLATGGHQRLEGSGEVGCGGVKPVGHRPPRGIARSRRRFPADGSSGRSG